VKFDGVGYHNGSMPAMACKEEDSQSGSLALASEVSPTRRPRSSRLATRRMKKSRKSYGVSLGSSSISLLKQHHLKSCMGTTI
jgi:hypothetical protein